MPHSSPKKYKFTVSVFIFSWLAFCNISRRGFQKSSRRCRIPKIRGLQTPAIAMRFDCHQGGQKRRKKTPIRPGIAIEKLGLSACRSGFNLQLSDLLDVHWVTNPGNTGSNHLLPSHCETIHLSFCEARWHGPYARHQPRAIQLTGVSFLGRLNFQIITDFCTRQ